MSDARGAVKPRRTQAQRRDESERHLLEVTARLVAERGTAGASFTDIAVAAGCSRSLPHYLFGTKLALLQRLAEDATDQFLEHLLGSELDEEGGLAAVTSCLDVFIRSLAHPWPRTRAIYGLIAESLGSLTELRPIIDHHHEVIRAHVARWIREGVERQEIRADVDVDAQATVVVGLLRGIGLQVLAEPDRFDVARLAAEAVESTRRSLAVG